MNKKEQVKERIGKAAMECFVQYGLDKTTLDDIANASEKISKGRMRR